MDLFGPPAEAHIPHPTVRTFCNFLSPRQTQPISGAEALPLDQGAAKEDCYRESRLSGIPPRIDAITHELSRWRRPQNMSYRLLQTLMLSRLIADSTNTKKCRIRARNVGSRSLVS